MRPGRLARPRAGAAQRFLRPPGLLFHARPQDWSRRPESHRHGQSRPAGFESAVSTFQPRRDKLVRTEGIAPSWTCAHRLLGPTRLLFRHVRKNFWIRHGDLRSALPDTNRMRRCLRFAGKNWSRRKDLHLRSPEGRRVYSALHLLLCHVSKWGLGQGLHLRPSPYEGAALTAAPPSRGRPPR